MVGPQVIWERIKDTSIVWTPLSTHYLDLMIKNITKLFWLKDVVSKVNHVENFVMNKPKVLAIYKTFHDLELLKFSKINYAYMFLVLEKLLKIYCIEEMIVCDAW
jgi:hypothetical protein